MEGFVIHALPVAGGILALSPIPGVAGDYTQDLAHIRDWKPALVVSMTQPEELSAAGAATLGPDLQDAGTRWVAFPVEDYGIPPPLSAPEWDGLSGMALAALQGGGRVLVHCKGGCGRSGMAVLRLMIEAGEDGLDALLRLRAVRPCAVETEAQMNWARQG